MKKDTIVIPPHLDKKYAILWHDANSHKVPQILAPMNYYKPLNKRDRQMYGAGIYQVMAMLADDGLIKQETLRRIHEQENNWLPGRSKITVGKVPIMTWISFGFVAGMGFNLLILVIGIIIRKVL